MSDAARGLTAEEVRVRVARGDVNDVPAVPTRSIARIVRASMLDVLSQDFVRTARAKGARETAVVMVHALRNALLPALTIIGFSVAYLLSGDVLVEDIFQWGGIGSYAVTAAESLDYPAIMGVVIVGGIAFLVASLLTDIGYAFADPQIRVA